MARLSFSYRALVGASAANAVLLVGLIAHGQPPMDGDGRRGAPWPVYERHAFDGHRQEDGRFDRDFRRDPRLMSPAISTGWFERPYPYHLDFFRMRFGGRVGPLGPPYGPTLPAYYGPYYTGYGIGYADLYGAPGYSGVPIGYRGYPNSIGTESGIEKSIPVETPADSPTDESLPAPRPS